MSAPRILLVDDEERFRVTLGKMLAAMKKGHPEVEVIILTGHASMDAALEIIKLGGYDYLLKPCPLEELLLKIDAAYEKKLEREKVKKLDQGKKAE
jgi:DNA-binding NtrC family response regulator